MRDGLNYNKNLDSRFNKIEALIEEQITKITRPVQEDIEKKIAERIKSSSAFGALSMVPNFFIVCYPDEPTSLRSIFSEDAESIKRKLENPPELRYSGWSLVTLNRAVIKEAKYIRVTNGDRKIVDLYNDGTFIFYVSADEDFLAWNSAEGDKLNCLAIVESVYNFSNFYGLVINDFSKTPNNIFIRYGFNNPWKSNRKSYLHPGSLNSFGYRFGSASAEKFEAPQASVYSDIINVETENYNPTEVGYKVIEQIYLWFGISNDGSKIPYIKQEKWCLVNRSRSD